MEGRGVFVACADHGVLERCLAPSRNVRKSSLERNWNASIGKTALALAAARAHEPANALTRRTPPPGLKLRALVVARLLAATDAFTAFFATDPTAASIAWPASWRVFPTTAAE